MSKRTQLHLILCLVLCTLSAVLIQAQTPSETRQRTLTVTASVTTEQVRFATLADVSLLRLEVYSVTGVKVFDSSFKLGNMFDWGLQDQQGQPLADGSYLCVVTAKEFSGHAIQRRGQVWLQAGQATLQSSDTTEAIRAPNPLTEIDRTDFLTVLTRETEVSTLLLAHDGQDGRLVSNTGGLSFRTGNFFAGKDVEHMRLTPEGNLGIGIAAPQAKLDVAGLIRTSEGLLFPDGTVQTTAFRAQKTEGESKPQGTRTLNVPLSVTDGALTKFTLGGTAINDSVVFQDGAGNLGVGTTAPGGVFDLQRASASDLLQRFWNTGTAGAKLRYVSQTGASAQIQLTDLAEWLSAIAGNNSIGLQFRVRDPGSPNTEAQLDASARLTILRNGNVGIGTTSPGFPLSVAGIIHSSSGGFRFPDGTVQTTAATGGVSSVTASAPLTSSGGTAPNISLNGVVPIANGGTGSATQNFVDLTNAQAIGGTKTFSSPINATTLNANTINAIGTINANIVNASSGGGVGYSIGSDLVLRSVGSNNIFVGGNAGPPAGTFGDNNTFVGISAGSTATSGGGNTYIGKSAGLSDISGTRNTMIGLMTSVGSQTNRSNATAIGANAQAECNDCVILGSVNGFNGASATVQIGIGTRTPTAGVQLDVQASSSNAGVRSQSANDSGVIGISNSNGQSNAGVYGRNTANGTAVFGQALGTGHAGYFEGKVFISGNLTVNGTFSNPSDIRLKEKITGLNYGLREVMQLRPVTWNWKAQPRGKLSLGLVAQEVEQVIPELVEQGKDTEQMLTLNYIGLVPVVIKAMQEQQTQIKQQQEQLQQQRTEIELLKQLLCAEKPTASVCQPRKQ